MAVYSLPGHNAFMASDLLRPGRHVSAVSAITFALAPTTALAEVMDKESVPWETGRLLVVAVVTLACAVAARRPGLSRAVLALALAAAWCFAKLRLDDFYDPYVGPAMRSELSPHEARAYQVLLPVEALMPAVAILVLLAVRRLRSFRER